MLRPLLAGIALITTASATAQMPDFFKKYAAKPNALVKNILSRQQLPAQAGQKPTVIKQRVIGIAQSDGFFTDSLAYAYSATRGSTYSYNAFGVGFNLEFDPAYAPMYYNEFMASYSDAMEADTIAEYFDGGVYYYAVASYNDQGKIDSTVNIFPEEGISNKTKAGYNAAGLLSETIRYEIQGSTETPVELRKVVYSEDNARHLADTLHYWNGNNWQQSQIITYDYDGQGKLTHMTAYDPMSPDNNIMNASVLSYNSDGLLEGVNVYMGEAVPENLFLVDSITYHPGTVLFSSLKEFFIWGGGAEEGIEISRSFNDNNLPDSAVYSYYEAGTGWELMGAFVFSYNAYANPETVWIYSIEDDEEASMAFYYEEYDDNTGIADKARILDIKVFPNPFEQVINFQLNDAGGQATAVITDMLGREMYRAAMPTVKGRNSIEIPALSAGNYLFHIQDNNGKMYRAKITKQ